MSKERGNTLIANNKKAYHEYFIEEKFEAGIELVRISGTLSDSKQRTVDTTCPVQPCSGGIVDCFVKIIVSMPLNLGRREVAAHHRHGDGGGVA